MFTVDLVVRTVPPNLKKSVTQHLVDLLNNVSTDPEIADAVRNNFLSYTSVLQDGRFKLEEYLNAVKFVSFLLMDMSKKDAYIKTFPDRYQRLLSEGADEQVVSSYVSMYAKGKLPNLILEQSLVPIWVLNQDKRQKAINRAAYLMANAKSEMVQITAANTLLTHLAPPAEAAKVNININQQGETTSLQQLEGMFHQLAAQQKQLIEQGIPTKTIAAQPIIDAEVVK